MKPLRALLILCAFLAGPVSVQAQQASWFLPKALGAVDGIMSRGRIANAGARPVVQASGLIMEPKLDVACADGCRSISTDYEFVSYLLDNNLKSDALTLMCSGLYEPSDTLSYLRGWTFYKYRYIADAVPQLRAVPPGSAFYDKSAFLSVAMLSYLGDYDSARRVLDGYTGTCSDVRSLQYAGLSLLEKDPGACRNCLSRISPDAHYAIAGAGEDLLSQAEWYESFRPRSPFLGGALSAVVPGLGKIYSGRTGEGIMAFLTVGSLAAITAENWVKCGPKDWKTILFGSLGAIFYVGNIYGSAVSVKVYNDNAFQNHEASVLVDIHIPLGSVFR